MMRLGFIAGSQKLEHKSKRLEHLQKNLHPTIDYIFLVIYQREKPYSSFTNKMKQFPMRGTFN